MAAVLLDSSVVIDVLKGRPEAARFVALEPDGDVPADALIAAAAVGIGARVATGNPKDSPMSDLVVEHWPAGK